MKSTNSNNFFARIATMLLIAVLTSVSAWAVTQQFPIYSGDEGTVEKPFHIKTIDDLNKLSADVISGTDYSGMYFKLDNDLNFYNIEALRPSTSWDNANSQENNFTPIGNLNKPFRGHIVREFRLNFGDNSEATGITTTDLTDYTDEAGAWYDLQGRKLQGQPAKKGIYIHGERKVAIN